MSGAAGEGGALERLRRRARGGGAVIALAEPGDPRVSAAALQARAEGICVPLLVGDAAALRAAGAPRLDGIECADPATDPRAPRLTALLAERLAARGLPSDQASQLARDPLHYAALLVAAGEADGAVMGA
ncbi:MAG TPA: phosphate acyltransferase, partial [Thermoanaerobaculia bacterium]|nr:phosphate acyltransferase [Thermoanaerobaculia bacterium]